MDDGTAAWTGRWWWWWWLWCLAVGGAGMCMAAAAHKVAEVLWWRPKRLERHFGKQGIRGPPYRFFLGCVREMVGMMLEASSKPMAPQNSHNILPRVLSFYHHWKKIYGSTFLMWFGPTPRLTVADPDLIREIFLSKAEYFERYESHPLVRQLEGEGLVSLRGEKWAHHRRVLTPTFYMENLKLLIPFIGRTAVGMVEELPASGDVEIDVAEWFQTLTEDAITRTAFGRSYDDGKAVFQLQTRQMVFASEAFRKVFIPGYRFLPTKRNTRSWKLDKEIKRSLITLIGRRRVQAADAEELVAPVDTDDNHGGAKDLLGLMIRATVPTTATATKTTTTVSPPSMSEHDIVEECKTFFFAGKQTTSNLLTWTTVMLAMHPEWQQRARDEVFRVCGPRGVPSREHLPKLKTLGLIINETLRLYPPAVATIRQAKADVMLGEYEIPAGTELLVPIMAVHHDTRLWGPDAARFDPTRFAEGASRAARHPMAFIPFGLGARMCIGQNLALLESKIALAAILQRFSFRLSPSYVHAPTVLMLLYPQYGAPIIFTRLPDPSPASAVDGLPVQMNPSSAR